MQTIMDAFGALATGYASSSEGDTQHITQTPMHIYTRITNLEIVSLRHKNKKVRKLIQVKSLETVPPSSSSCEASCGAWHTQWRGSTGLVDAAGKPAHLLLPATGRWRYSFSS